MKNKRGTFWILLGAAFLLTALCLTAYNLLQEQQAAQAARQAVTQLEDTIRTEPVAAQSPDIPTAPIPGGAPSSGSDPAEEEIPDYLLNPDMDMPAVNIDGIDYIGILEIPALELSLPIIRQWSDSLLQVAPCRYYGSAYTGDLTLMAHNFDSHFGRLDTLAEGDTVIFTDVDENVFTYCVSATEILPPYAVEDMIGSDWPLTLFTCTVGGANRVTVRCDRTA